ncbi:MAG: heparinase II/III family protein [Candidatus Firestonebacteria bacterium]|nr:heparinase II/III family protein [Candidatus Firestonebacteria bacterium]
MYRFNNIYMFAMSDNTVCTVNLRGTIDGAGGHIHSDKLSIDYSIGKTNIIVDAGQGCYMSDFRLRKLFRSEKSHSTLTVDKK